jgi:delta8-fatty-acid desaturase
MDWFHGGLQFQAVHHCFPRIPRHNLRRLREEVVLPLCKKHGLEYKIAGFYECNRMVLSTLAGVSGELHEYLKDGWTLNG